MVFCHEWLQVNDGQICAVPLSDNLGKATGEPVILSVLRTGHGCKDDEEQRMGNGRPFLLQTEKRCADYAVVQLFRKREDILPVMPGP